MKGTKFFAAAIATLIAIATVSYGQSNPVIAGKTSHITLERDTSVGASLLGPGDYEVRHVGSATGHWIEFTRMVDNTGEVGLSPSPLDWAVVARVPCTMESLNKPVARTSAETAQGVAARLNNLRIRGENVVHVFEAEKSAAQN